MTGEQAIRICGFAPDAGTAVAAEYNSMSMSMSMPPPSSLSPAGGGGGKNTVRNKEPRPVACTNCHSSKVRCEKSFPCKRCVRLKMEDKCLPHNSQQGRGTKKRRRDKDGDGSRGNANEEEEKTKAAAAAAAEKKKKSKPPKKRRGMFAAAAANNSMGAVGNGMSSIGAGSAAAVSKFAAHNNTTGATRRNFGIGGGFFGTNMGGIGNAGSVPALPAAAAAGAAAGGFVGGVAQVPAMQGGAQVASLPLRGGNAGGGRGGGGGGISNIMSGSLGFAGTKSAVVASGTATPAPGPPPGPAIAAGPKTGIEENLSVSATSLGPNHFGLRHLLRTWLAFAIKRRSFSLLAKASTLAARTGITMDNILCGEDDSVSVLSGGGGAAHVGEFGGETSAESDPTDTTSPSLPNTSSSAAAGLTEPMNFLLPALLTPASCQHLESTPLSWAELPAELLTATGCRVPLTHAGDGIINDIAPILGSRWIFVRWLHQGRSRYFVSPAFERDIVSWATVQSTWNANNREVTGLFVPRSEMPTHTRGIMHQFAIHPRAGMPMRANRYKTKIKVRAAVAPVGSVPSAEDPGMVEMGVDGVMCQKMISLDTAFLFIEYVRDEVTPATVLASLSSREGAVAAAATAVNDHSQHQQSQPQLHGAMSGIGSGSLVPNQAQVQGNQFLTQMAAKMIGAGNAGGATSMPNAAMAATYNNQYSRTSSNASGNSLPWNKTIPLSDAIHNRQQQQQQQRVGGSQNNSGTITPQAMMSGAGGTGSGLDGLDFFDLDGGNASLAEMDELLNLIRQCP